ncbi:MAG: primosomal protein N' [Candidatus Saccharibacteria bacterium]|nr:primosomal protein N' [Candidatus Saccharibacteria bacterium]
MFYEVIPGKAGVRSDVLTYTFDGELTAGQIVEIPLGKNTIPGVVVKKVVQPDFPCRAISKILYSKPLPKHLLKTARFIAEYYTAPVASVLTMMLPNGVLKNRRRKSNRGGGPDNESSAEGGALGVEIDEQGSEGEKGGKKQEIRLNPAQKMALEALRTAPGATKLLFGVTGSGKTNIYLSEAEKALKTQKSVILLVPEIALTGQLVQVFREIFGNKVALIHSKQTEAERHLIFEDLLQSEEPKVVIGPRSALFAPLSNLGLIIIDEEHEPSYYQENSPRYSAIRVASFMARELSIPCILGSATPEIADYYMAEKQGSLVRLKEKAKKEAIKPKIEVIDFKKRENFSKNRYFSNSLLEAIRENLKSGCQTLIFHNRRGSSPMTICEECGAELVCPTCFLPLTLHADSYSLTCHTCGFTETVPGACPTCGAAGLIHKGFGTKLLESEISRLFPTARVKRFDADNKKGESLDAIYDRVRDGEVDIMIGTQMLAKGLDLPRLATVGVVQADAGLSLPDFAAEERTFQLLTQVIGRVGRGHIEKAEVFIQTFRPEHPVIQFGINEDYEGFSEYLLERRRKGGFPPFRFIAKLEITMKTEKAVISKVRAAGRILTKNPNLTVSTPMPAFHERTIRGYTWQIIVRGRSRKALVSAITGLDPNFKVTLDPPSLL